MTPVDAPLGLLLRRLDALITERFDRSIGRRDISRRQWQLLSTLTGGPMTGESLAAAVAPFLDRTVGETVAPHLDPLARRGLVSFQDGVWQLTPDGRIAVRELADEVRAIREQTTAGIDEQTYGRTVAALERMIGNLAPAP